MSFFFDRSAVASVSLAVEGILAIPLRLALAFDSLPAFHVYVTAPMSLFMGLYWILSLLYAGADFILEKFGRLARFKRQEHLFQRPDFRFDRRLYVRTALGALRNQLTVSLSLSILMMPLWNWRGVSYGAPFPSLWTIAWQLPVVVLVQEVGFYYAHRLLHRPFWYKKVHYLHHTWASPVACAAHYAHPLEHLLANSLPFLAGPLLVGLHWQLFLAWFALGTVVVVRSHSGYRWGFLGSADHDRHHRSFLYNYGIMMWWDYLHGTIWHGTRTVRGV